VLPRNVVSSLDFSPQELGSLIGRLSGAPAPNTQTEYLATYLQALDTSAIVVEEHYIDRHFMEELASYYARCLVQKPNHCARLHFFAELSQGRVVTDQLLDDLMRLACSGSQSDIQRDLQAAYRGFIVVRPLPSVPIGRTALAATTADGITATTVRYPVHLLGLELHVESLAFQQQDRAVGACATTACWSALQRLSRHDGGRSSTPSQITEAAVRHFLPAGRPFPSRGLTIEQISEAFRALEFPPLLFEVGSRPEFFKLRLGCYLRSQIPVVLALRLEDGSGHAVTTTGIKDCNDDFLWTEELGADGEPSDLVFRVRNCAFKTILVHDDRIGPFVPSRLQIDGEQLRIELDLPGKQTTDATVDLAIAPLYPKLRTSAQDLFEAAVELLPLVEALSGSKGDVIVEIFFDRAGTYLASLYDSPIHPARIARFQRQITLSRYVGVVRWETPSGLLLDTLWDTTDMGRETRQREQLLAIVCYDEQLSPAIDQLADNEGFLSG